MCLFEIFTCFALCRSRKKVCCCISHKSMGTCMFIMEILELLLTLSGIFAIVILSEMILVQVSLFLILNLVPLFLRISGTIAMKVGK